ncbi:DoxX family protein [Clavibacter michiganensis]|uniref:DoxX family protein n=1 Tax=Clavibacter michiganensis TaxID=28447 RepID=A0A2S5VV83_9MICO|nr:DoxX family protein [Clavibacter michiganensis]PPF68570.1 DoxX family protein [Clavibacter michiganensis]
MLIALWAVSAMLAVAMLGAGILKLVRSRQALVDGGMPWAESVPAGVVKAIAALEVVGAIGLVLPLATGIAPVLSPVAAVGLAVLMAGAVVVHARRREPVVPPLALLVLALAAAVLGFVALG